MKELTLLGDDLYGSYSPDLHQKIARIVGYDVVYGLCSVDEDLLEETVEYFLDNDYRGFNVTIPYKTTVMKYLDRISEKAECIGAVNTVLIKDRKTEGFNTDWSGFLDSLRMNNYNVSGKKATVIGAGGAACAVCYALIVEDVEKLLVLNRTKNKALKMTERFEKALDFRNFGVYELTENVMDDGIRESDMIINCTPLGTSPETDPVPLKIPEQNSWEMVYDLVYNPLETEFLKRANQAGKQTIGGAAMLMYQAVRSWEKWFDIELKKKKIVGELESVIQIL